MKNSVLGLIAVAGSFMTACEEQDIPVFGTEQYVYFEKFWKDAPAPGTEKADSTEITFYFNREGDNTLEADLVMVYAGRRPEQDINFRLRVVEDETTALPDEYTLQDTYTLRSSVLTENLLQMQDTIHIQFNLTDRLNTLDKGYRLVLEIVPENELQIGQYERSRAIVFVSKDPVRPSWWNAEVTNSLLGPYSPKKYKLFIDNVEGAQDIDEYMLTNNPDIVRKLVLEFKKWLIENPSYEDDGTLIEVEI